MASAVETLFSEGDEVVLKVLPSIAAFMDNPSRICALRLILIGLANKTQKSEFSFSALFNEWNRLLGLMGAKGNRATKIALDSGIEINEHTIQRYVFLRHEPHDPKRMAAQLALLAAHYVERAEGINSETHRLIKSARDAAEFIEPIRNFLTTRNLSFLNHDPNAIHSRNNNAERTAAQALRALLTTDADDQKNIARWLFGQLDADSVFKFQDRSYYVLYRYSTLTPQIVKSLLVVDSPALSGLNAFSFTHVYLARRDTAKRISRGTLVSFPHSIYFVGMSAHVLRGLDQLGRAKVDIPRGLKIFVVPASEAQTDSDLLAGIYMSNGLRWNPIVGRIVLVPVGFRSVVGSLSDAQKEIRPTVLPGPEALEEDLRKISSIPNCAVTEGRVADLTQRALIRINNRPYCDRDRPDVVVEGIMRALQTEDEQIPSP
jgi:hypothetical protein